MGLRAYVLHLARARARRGAAEALLEECGLPGEIWPALDGEHLAPELVAQATTTQAFDPHYPFSLNRAEVACFLGHWQIWQAIAEGSAEAGLVFEDDAALELDGFATALTLARRHIADLGVIQLQTRPVTSTGQLIDQIGGARLTVPRVTPLRATATVISRAAAATLVRQATPFDRPVDTFLQCHWHTGQRLAAIWPSGVREISAALGGTTIQHRPRSLTDKLRREAARGIYRFRVRRYARHSGAPMGLEAP